MPQLALYTELQELAQSVRPETRFEDLAIWFRRLTVESPVPLPDGTELAAPDGTRIRIRNIADAIICSSFPPGRSGHLEDGTALTSAHGTATLRAEVLAKFGGRWDYHNERFTGEEPDAPLRLDCQESQVAIVRHFYAFWLAFKARSPLPRPRATMVWSDRRAGKTWICWLLTVAATLDCPLLDGQELIVWAVSVNYKERKELDRYVRQVLPRGWYRFRFFPDICVDLPNGGRIYHISADDPETLKQGQADLVFMNEAAKMDSRPFENAGPGTADRAGHVLLATNPPHMGSPNGYWVQELYEQWEEANSLGDPLPMHFMTTTSKWNVAIDANARSDWGRLLKAVNPNQALADDEGKLLPRGDFAYRPPFSDLKHVRRFDLAEWEARDITRAITAQRVGQPFDYIMGTDFQHWPAMVGVPLKLFGDPENPTVWALGDFWIERADEDALIDAFEDDAEWVYANPEDKRPPRFTAANTLVIGDSTGSFQNGRHERSKTSFAVFRARGWTILPVIPAREVGKFPTNPLVPLSVARVHKFLDAERLFIAYEAQRLKVSLKHCRTKRGKFGLYPTGDEAHLTDALRYPIWWLLPQRAPKESTVRRMNPTPQAAPAGRRYAR